MGLCVGETVLVFLQRGKYSTTTPSQNKYWGDQSIIKTMATTDHARGLCLVAALLVALISSVQGGEILNPDGYLIGKFYEFTDGGGNIEAVNAWAINSCVPNGYTGYPYPNTYVRITPVFYKESIPYVTVVTYDAAGCNSFNFNETLQLNAFSNVGADPYLYFSSALPDWDNFDNGYLVQKIYSYAGSGGSTCPGDREVLRATWYYNGCVFDCGYGGSDSCQWTGCASQYNYSSGIAFISIYDEEYCPAEDFLSTAVVSPSCTQSITCLNSSATPTCSSSSTTINGAAAVGITFTCTLVGTIAIMVLFYSCYWSKRVMRTNTVSVEARYPSAPPAIYLMEPIMSKNDAYTVPTAVNAMHVTHGSTINDKL
jgi:hypothetical protein